MAPRHVERTDFFQSFFEKLKQHEEIKDLRVSLVDTAGGRLTYSVLRCPLLLMRPLVCSLLLKAVEDAFVPVIKFKFDGIEVSFIVTQMIIMITSVHAY